MSAEVKVQAGLFDCRDAFAATIEELAAKDERIVAVVNDSLNSTKLKGFKAKFPTRFVNVGIAEQNMVGVGAGLANGGSVPFVCGASCFLTARAMEQVKVDLGYAKNNVKLCGMSSGMAYGELGPTHHSIEDLAWTRVIPNLTVVVPADPVETRAAIIWAAEHEGPVFLRLSRIPVPVIHAADYVFEPGKAVTLREGSDVTVIANGVLVTRALGSGGSAGEGWNFGARGEYVEREADRSRCDFAGGGGDAGNCNRGRTLYLWWAGWGGGGDSGGGASYADEDTWGAGRVCAYGVGGVFAGALWADGGGD